MKKILLPTLFLFLLLSLPPLKAQEAVPGGTETPPETAAAVPDSLTLAAPAVTEEALPVLPPDSLLEDYGTLLGIAGYDSLPPDALLPVTRKEAEEIIAATILAGRAPGREAIRRAEILNDYKVEMLKHRLLDQALRKSYADEYEQRLNRLEAFLMLLLANNGVNPSAVTTLLNGLGAAGTPSSTVILPGQPGYVPGQGGYASPYTLPNAMPYAPLSDGTAASGISLPGEGSERITTIPLAPGAKAASWEHFLSQVFYSFDSAALDARARRVLDDVAGWVRETGMGVTLRGWTSPEGRMSYNNKLSGRRVRAAANYLESKGVPARLLKVIPSGIDSMKDTKRKYPAGRRVDIRPDYGEKIPM